jgi:glutathione S-transferase
MHSVALVTLLLVCQYVAFMMLCGAARSKSGIKAPAVTGDDNFERAYRVQMNTLEQLVITLPAMWLCAMYFSDLLAAGLGLVFFVGRIIYRGSYVADPTTRGPGMIISFLANIGLLVTALWGVIATF